MKAQKDHRHHVECRNPPDVECLYDIVIHVAFHVLTAGMERAGGEVENVIHDEDEQQHPAPSHEARRERRCLRHTRGISIRPRSVTLLGERVGGGDVKDQRHYQYDTCGPEQLRPGPVQKVAV